MIVQDVLDAYARFAANVFWPGFDPQAIPLAIYDGEHTWLNGFPHCPAGFVASDAEAALAYRGWHPAVRANSVAELDGVPVATLVINCEGQNTSTAYAALALHEAFHVFQQRAYSGWAANESDLFTYPVDDPRLVALARQEDVCLERALHETERGGWAAAFAQAREIRFAAMLPAAVRYERQTELAEGLAQYQEWRALGRAPEQIDWTGNPCDVRRRCYRTGAAIAYLLDRLVPDWKGQLMAETDTSLDALLAAAPGVRSMRPFAISSDDLAAITAQADRDVAAAIACRGQTREAFLARPGRRLVIVAAPDEPLRVRGFDPMNATLVGPGEVLHNRYLELASSDGVLELLDGRALTEAAGTHPLFDGVQTVILTGLVTEPDIEETRDGLIVAAPGCRLSCKGGEIEYTPGTDIVRLGLHERRQP